MSSAQSLGSFCTPCKSVGVSTSRKGKTISFPTAGRMVTIRRIGGLLLAAICVLLTGKVPLQTFQDDPLDRVVTQDDDNDEARSAIKRKEEVKEEVEVPPPPAREPEPREEAPPPAQRKNALLNSLLDTAQEWDRRDLFRESDGLSGKRLPAGIAEFPGGLRCVSEIDRPGIRPQIISQDDLAELEILGKRSREAKRRYEKKREAIRRARESGARVEAGARALDLVVVVR
jgi:hypothetical protein